MSTTDGIIFEPSAPYPQPDPNDPCDGINDTENTELSHFLKNVGTGREGLSPPSRESKHWPPIDEKYTGISSKYYRSPDIIIGERGFASLVDEKSDELTEVPYDKLLLEVMKMKGIYKKRGIGSKIVRAVSTTLLSVTGIGAVYVAAKTRQIKPGEIGMFYTLNKNPRFIPSGWSMETNPMHGSFRKFNILDKYINFMNHVHIIRVMPGEVVAARINGNSVLLESGNDNRVGVHIIVDTTFEHIRRESINNRVIHVSPLAIITVSPGEVHLVNIDRKPHVLFEGRHVFECSTLILGENYKLDNHLDLGIIHYYIVKPGELGGIRVNDHACFIDHPCHLWFYSQLVETMDCVKLEKGKVDFGPLTRVIVDDYLMGIVRDENGQLVVLRPGVHVIKRPNIHLATTTGEWTHFSHQMCAITADPLDVKLKITMAYHVVDPIAFFKAGTPENAHKAVEKLAISTMSQIIRHMRFEETLKTHEKKYDNDDEELEEEGESPARLIRKQWQTVSDMFTTNFQRILKRDFGITMDESAWGFQDFDFVDQKLQNQLTNAVFARSEARAERVRLNLTRDTASIRKQNAEIKAEMEKFEQTLQAKTKREISLLEVQTEQEVANARVESEHKRKLMERDIEMKDAESKADASFYTIKKASEANAIKMKQEADSQAYMITTKANAEKEMLEKNPEHFKLKHAEIQANALKGMNPQVYLGDVGGASLQQALASVIGKFTNC